MSDRINVVINYFVPDHTLQGHDTRTLLSVISDRVKNAVSSIRTDTEIPGGELSIAVVVNTTEDEGLKATGDGDYNRSEEHTLTARYDIL
jgi:hypothetical protein